MTSTILRIAARHLMPILLIASLVLLFRGHNAPGGGFIGGLLAAAAIALRAMSQGVDDTRRMLRVDPRVFTAVGLLLALGSGLPALLIGQPLFTGLWLHPDLPLLGSIPLGTPLLFDVGIYCTVIGFTLTILFAISDIEDGVV